MLGLCASRRDYTHRLVCKEAGLPDPPSWFKQVFRIGPDKRALHSPSWQPIFCPRDSWMLASDLNDVASGHGCFSGVIASAQGDRQTAGSCPTVIEFCWSTRAERRARGRGASAATPPGIVSVNDFAEAESWRSVLLKFAASTEPFAPSNRVAELGCAQRTPLGAADRRKPTRKQDTICTRGMRCADVFLVGRSHRLPQIGKVTGSAKQLEPASLQRSLGRGL
jgi:hypothetical protein